MSTDSGKIQNSKEDDEDSEKASRPSCSDASPIMGFPHNPDFKSPILKKAPSLLHLAFNQDASFFSAGTTRGFRIYSTEPYREIFRRDFFTDAVTPYGSGGLIAGGIGIVGMLFRCFLLALVGGGPEPQYPRNKVMIWDENQSQCIAELSFRTEVKGVRLTRERIFAVLTQKLVVYNLTDLKLVNQIETYENPNGLCEVSHVSGSSVLVCLGLLKGQVRVEHDGSKRIKFISAHKSRIACFALTQDGRMLATASTTGTLIRIFNTLDGSMLQEVRRGKDKADIHSLAFSSSAQWLAVSSNRGTVHVFSLKIESGILGNDKLCGTPEPIRSTSSTISSIPFIRGVLPKYFSSEWSVARCHLTEGVQYTVAFGKQQNTVIILGMDGREYLDSNKSLCERGGGTCSCKDGEEAMRAEDRGTTAQNCFGKTIYIFVICPSLSLVLSICKRGISNTNHMMLPIMQLPSIRI